MKKYNNISDDSNGDSDGINTNVIYNDGSNSDGTNTNGINITGINTNEHCLLFA